MKIWHISASIRDACKIWHFCVKLLFSPHFRFHVPVAFYVMLSASHLLLVVNSSINVLIYCAVGKSFRAELKVLMRSICRR